jgi:hypothetical protein
MKCRWIMTAITAGITVAFAQPMGGNPDARMQLPITITLFDRAGLRPGVLTAMKAETSSIFREAGIALEWVDCETEGPPSAECLQPLGAARKRLELFPGSDKKAPWLSGLATFQGGSSVSACLYPDRLRELAMKASWDFGDLLGHAAAHELGHLLLRSAGHSPAGLMRASWEVKDLWRLPHAGLIFLPGQLQVVAVQTRLARKER